MSRTITGKLRHFVNNEPLANTPITFRLRTDVAVEPGEAFPIGEHTITTDATGDIPAGFALAVPPTGAWRYSCKISGNRAFDFYLEAGAAMTIDDIVALAGIAGTEPAPIFVPSAHAASHATAGSDPLAPADIGAEVAGATAAHNALTGTAVHGLGTMSTEAEIAFAKLAGRAGGQTLIGGTAVNNALVLQGTSASGNTATAVAAQIKVGEAGAQSAVTVLNNGDVGVGTASPAKKLDISGQENITLRLTNTEVSVIAGETLGTIEFFGSDSSGTGPSTRGYIKAIETDAGGAVGRDYSLIFGTYLGSLGERMRIDPGGNVGINTTAPTAQHHIVSGAAARIAQIIQLAATPTANAQEIRNSGGTVLSATRPDGSWQPPQIAAAAAANNSLFVDTGTNKLSYRDTAGVTHALY